MADTPRGLVVTTPCHTFLESSIRGQHLLRRYEVSRSLFATAELFISRLTWQNMCQLVDGA